MLIPIQLHENYIYYLNLTKVNGLTLVDRTNEKGYVAEWYLYLDKDVYKIYKTNEEAVADIEQGGLHPLIFHNSFFDKTHAHSVPVECVRILEAPYDDAGMVDPDDAAHVR